VPGLDTEALTSVLFGTQSTSAIVAAVDRFEVHAQRSAAAACGGNVARLALRALLAKVSSSRP
jgi:hypothetical protein